MSNPVDLPSRRPGRAARIATIHGLATFLAEHPDVDTPDWVRACRVLDGRDHPHPAARIDAVQRFAQTHGVPVGEGPLYVWAVIPIGSHDVHGLHVDYCVQAAKCPPRILASPFPPAGPMRG